MVKLLISHLFSTHFSVTNHIFIICIKINYLFQPIIKSGHNEHINNQILGSLPVIHSGNMSATIPGNSKEL